MAEDGRAELDRLLFEADNLILIESQAPESDAGASQQFSATRREELDFLLRQADTVARATMGRSGSTEQDIDLTFGWNERMYNQKMQYHYETRFNRDKRYRVTMYL